MLDFSDHLRFTIGRDLMANLSGGDFKNYIISLIQEYSRKMALDGEQISLLFSPVLIELLLLSR